MAEVDSLAVSGTIITAPSAGLSHEQPTPNVAVPPLPDKHSAIINRIDRKYGAFLNTYRAQGKDAAKLQSMLVERQVVAADILEIAQAQGFDARDPASRTKLMTMISSASNEQTRAIRQTLGEADYRDLLIYETKEAERNVSETLKKSLSTTGAPLTEEQQARFVEMLYKLHDPGAGRYTINGSWDSAGGPNDDRNTVVRVLPLNVVDTMRPVLSEEQLQKLSEIVQQQARIRTTIFEKR